ncbi:MAG: serine/threonine-protein kinase, partial [Planctomycetaceae bacterium]
MSLPKQLGKYTLVRKLGQGGMGSVYLATDTTLKRSVALKLLSPEKAENPTLKKRFQAEAEAAACLKHEHIVAIYETGEIDGTLFLALEYVDGTDTANLVLRRGTLPVKRSIEVVRQVALALQHAGTHRLVHRDIKPGNILIRRDGVVKLADLGLARVIDANLDTSITRTGTTVGTIDYISPEQARSSKLADGRSDLYSLGCTWYFLLTGEPPFADGDVTNKLQAHATRPFPNPRDKNPQVPEGLVAVMRRLTEKDPDRRYQSATELLEDLEVIQHGGEQLSQAILQEDLGDPDSGDVEVLDDEARPRRKRRPTKPITTRDLPRGDLKPLLPNREPQGSDLSHALKKYGVLGGGVAAAIAAVVWLATQLAGGGGDGSERNLGKELANAAKREVQETRIGGQGGAAGPGIGPAPAAGDPAANNRQIGEPAGVPPDMAPGQAVPPGEAGGTNQQLGGAGPPGTGAALPGTLGGPGGGTGANARTQAELAALPSWVAAPATSGSAPRPTLVVDVRNGGAQVHATLNAALRAVTGAGARIELRGPGPHVLKAAVLRDAGRVSLVASDRAETPLVVLQPPDAGAVHAFLTCVNTTLELDGVHLAADVTGYQTQPSDALIHVVGGDLIVRDSSLSARGLPVTGMAALRLGGSVAGGPAAATPAKPPGAQTSGANTSGANTSGTPINTPSPDGPRGGVVRGAPPAGPAAGGRPAG